MDACSSLPSLIVTLVDGLLKPDSDQVNKRKQMNNLLAWTIRDDHSRLLKSKLFVRVCPRSFVWSASSFIHAELTIRDFACCHICILVYYTKSLHNFLSFLLFSFFIKKFSDFRLLFSEIILGNPFGHKSEIFSHSCFKTCSLQAFVRNVRNM